MQYFVCFIHVIIHLSFFFVYSSFHRIIVDMERQDLYGFLCPASTTRDTNTVEGRTSYVGYAMGETKLPCYLAPIVQGYVS